MMILACPNLQLRRHSTVSLAVVVVRVVRHSTRSRITDGDARRDDQKGVGEAGVLRVGALVESVPGDERP